MEPSTQKKLKGAKMATQPTVAAIAHEKFLEKVDAEDVKTAGAAPENTDPALVAPACGGGAISADRQPAGPHDTDVHTAATPADDDGGHMLKALEIEALVAQAEERGYLRGRNENIERLMRQPGMLQQEQWNRETSGQQDSEPMILNNLRVSIWDR